MNATPRLDPCELAISRFASLRSLSVLLGCLPGRRRRVQRVLDVDARDQAMARVAPAGSQVVFGDGAPIGLGAGRPGFAFDPARPPFPAGSFRVVAAGPSIWLRQGADRRACLRGLLSLATEVLVVDLPPGGVLGEVGIQALGELLERRGLGASRWARQLEGFRRSGPLTPLDVEEALAGDRAAVHFLDAADPAGGLVLAALRALVSEPGAETGPGAGEERLLEFLRRFHNLGLAELPATLQPLYGDLVLILPGRRSLPRAVARRLREEKVQRLRPRATDLSLFELILRLEELERERRSRAGSSARPPAPDQRAELVDLRTRFDGLLELVAANPLLGTYLRAKGGGWLLDRGLVE